MISRPSSQAPASTAPTSSCGPPAGPAATCWDVAATGNPWGAPGCSDPTCDFRAPVEDGLITDGPRRWHSWNVTNTVREWGTGSLRNYGFLLRGDDSANLFFFDSADSTDATHRPRLVITYH